MKNQLCTRIAAILCSVLFCTAVYAQKQTLEQVLPAAVQKALPQMQADVAFLMNKVLSVNPGFRNKSQVVPNFNTALMQLQQQKPAYKNVTLPEVTPQSYDQLIANKTKQLGAQSGVVKILVGFKEGLAKAESTDDVVAVMVTLIKSPVFQAMPAGDKDKFYYAFASAKISVDYGTKNNLIASVTHQPAKMGVGGFLRLDGDDDDDEYYMARGAVCHWLCTMAGAVAGAYVGAEGGAVAGAAIGFGIGANACY